MSGSHCNSLSLSPIPSQLHIAPGGGRIMFFEEFLDLKDSFLALST